jgi:hypothetical protein
VPLADAPPDPGRMSTVFAMDAYRYAPPMRGRRLRGGEVARVHDRRTKFPEQTVQARVVAHEMLASLGSMQRTSVARCATKSGQTSVNATIACRQREAGMR